MRRGSTHTYVLVHTSICKLAANVRNSQMKKLESPKTKAKSRATRFLRRGRMIRRSVTGGGLCAELGRSVTEGRRAVCFVAAAAGCDGSQRGPVTLPRRRTFGHDRSLRRRLHRFSLEQRSTQSHSTGLSPSLPATRNCRSVAGSRNGPGIRDRCYPGPHEPVRLR